MGSGDGLEGKSGGLPNSGIASLGNREILNGPLVAFFCSQQCPGRIILKTFELARQWRDAGVTVVGGFHAPMEQEVLAILLRGAQPVVVCPGRSVVGMRVPREWRVALDAGRLLVVSPFEPTVRRVTAETALRRNRFVAGLAQRVFVAYAAPGGQMEVFCHELLAAHRLVYTFESEDTRTLVQAGAVGVRAEGEVWW